MSYIINRKQIELKAGVSQEVALPRVIKGDEVTCRIECNLYNGKHKRIYITATGENTLSIKKMIDSKMKNFSLSAEELISSDEADYKFDTLTLKADEDMIIILSIIEDEIVK